MIDEIRCTRCDAPECDDGMDECTDCSRLLCHTCAEDQKHLGLCPRCEKKARKRMIGVRGALMLIAKRFGAEKRRRKS